MNPQSTTHNPQLKRGFTLIEILVAVGITGTVALAFLGLQYILNRAQVEVYRNYLSIDEANNNISVMVRELRNARQADSGAYPLELAHDQEIIFYTDYDFDGDTERIRYYLNGTNLVREAIEPQGFPITYPEGTEKTKTVAENVRNEANPIFYYYNEDWPEDAENNPLATPARLSDTKLMNVYLEINPKEDDEIGNYILESYVQLRTLKENL